MKHHISDFHTIVFDFDGVFTNNKVYLSTEGVESVLCDRSDGLGIAILKSYLKKHNLLDIELFVLTKEKVPIAKIRMEKLGVDCVLSQDDKFSYIKNYLIGRFGRCGEGELDGVLYFGNDLNDLEVMMNVGASIAPKDAHHIVKSNSTYVFEQNGGCGFVRSAIECLIQLNNLNVEEVNELVSNC